MEDKEKIKEYALKNYKKTFIKKVITRDSKGKIIRRQFIDLEPIVSIKDNHIEVKNHIDASPIILSKNILK
jgi:hypothetical protein|tara:strand:- start:639 stop:851 length:213 start_codon:yes stop_codon:yes gene_type:complete